MRPEWQIGGVAQTLEAVQVEGMPLIHDRTGKASEEIDAHLKPSEPAGALGGQALQSFPGTRFAFAAVESARRR